jgi:hypothetical protein
VEESKGIFPWKLLASIGHAYLDYESLPTDAADWESDLQSKEIDQIDVDEALRLFEEERMTCVRDYLIYYLR